MKSVAKALAMIEELASSPRALSAIQLSRQLKVPRSTIYRLLQTLARHGFIVREDGMACYRLSFKLLDLGHRVLERTDLLEAARPILRDLSARFRETVHLAVEEDGRMVYLDKVEGSAPFCTHSRPGRRVPMHCTALGKAVLAYLPAERVRAILGRHGLQGHTARTIVSYAGMVEELEGVRRRGYALDDVEFEEGVRCVGAPVLDHRGVPMAAISVSAPISRMSKAQARRTGKILCAAVAGVSGAMGWQVPGRRSRAGSVSRVT